MGFDSVRLSWDLFLFSLNFSQWGDLGVREAPRGSEAPAALSPSGSDAPILACSFLPWARRLKRPLCCPDTFPRARQWLLLLSEFHACWGGRLKTKIFTWKWKCQMMGHSWQGKVWRGPREVQLSFLPRPWGLAPFLMMSPVACHTWQGIFLCTISIFCSITHQFLAVQSEF